MLTAIAMAYRIVTIVQLPVPLATRIVLSRGPEVATEAQIEKTNVSLLFNSKFYAKIVNISILGFT